MRPLGHQPGDDGRLLEHLRHVLGELHRIGERILGRGLRLLGHGLLLKGEYGNSVMSCMKRQLVLRIGLQRGGVGVPSRTSFISHRTGWRGRIVSGAGTWGSLLRRSGRLRGRYLSWAREGGAGAAQRGSRRWLVSKAPVQRPRPAGLCRTQGASKPAVPAGQLPEGAGVIMPPGPCVPFPGAGVRFPNPQARRSIPSEAAVATRTPSGASARTIGTVGIKCQEISLLVSGNLYVGMRWAKCGSRTAGSDNQTAEAVVCVVV